MNIFWAPEGPRLRYERGVLYIDDLNPELSVTWILSRWDMLKIGIKTCLAALKP